MTHQIILNVYSFSGDYGILVNVELQQPGLLSTLYLRLMNVN